MRHRVGMSVAAAVWIAGLALADPPQEKLDLNQIMSQIAIGGGLNPAAEPPSLPPFDEVTKGMTSTKGLFTLWSYPEGTPDKDTERLLAQIPSSFIGEKFMISTSISGGGFFTGFPLEEYVGQWELRDNQLLLIQPQTQYVVNNDEVSDAVKRTYPDTIRTAIPLVTKAPNGDPVVDFGSLLKSDFANITSLSGGGGINSSLSTWTKKKTFELNVEIGVELAMSGWNPPGSYTKQQVHYSFWKLPQTNYTPRIADDRVGYFLTANQDWSKPTGDRELFNRYIDRWQLEKRDPSLKLCEPKQPIIFYIEKTVPVRFRRAVRDGIAEWNKAFEEIGFLNAVEVRQQTDDNEWKDLDPEDMRFSFFRWIVTGGGFAMGPHRANPFTGQIYDADIVFDDSMVRYFEMAAQQNIGTEAFARKAGDPTLAGFFKAHPEFRRPAREWEHFDIGKDDTVERQKEAYFERMRNRGHLLCDYMQGMAHQMAFSGAMLSDAPADVKEEFIYDVIKEVVAHEVGHTLGLRHNFIASTIYSVDEIKTRMKTSEPTTGSVMDYNPTLFFTGLNKDVNFVTPVIGPYDHWAIEYGYRPFDSSYQSKNGEEDADKGEKSKEEPKESGSKDAKDKSAKTAAAPATTQATPTSSSITVSADEIPAEVLNQLPPDIKKMIESGNMEGLMAAHGGATPTTVVGAPSGPAFATPVAGEEEMLKDIAGRSTEPLLAYATDEDCTSISPDPRVNRFDCGADPIDWAKERMKLIDERMANLTEWSVKDAESWYFLTNTFTNLMSEKSFVLDYVGRYVGGVYFNRAHKGDPNAQAPFKVVDAETQRKAMAFIEETLFTDKHFTVSAELLNHLAPPRWYHTGASINYTVDFPYHDMISVMQWWNLFDRLYPNTLRRIQDSELKSNGSDKFTLAEYLQRIQKACWSDTINAKRLKDGTWTDQSPFVSDVRRSLQREYLGLIEPLVRQRPGTLLSPDIHAMLRYSLTKLGKDLDAIASASKADFASQAHVESCKSRIERMLSPELNEFGSDGGGGDVMMRTTGQK